MVKQTFDRIKKTLCIFTLIFFGISFTATLAGAYPAQQPLVSFTFDDNYIGQTSILDVKGVKGTIGVITSDNNYDLNRLHELENSGWEISSHSVDHNKLYEWEYKDSRDYLISQGFDVTGFLTPFGGANDTQDMWAQKYYKWTRDVVTYPVGYTYYSELCNYPPITTYHLKGTETGGHSLTELENIVDAAATNNYWIIWIVHNGDMSDSDLSALIDYIKAKNIRILPVRSALNIYEGLPVANFSSNVSSGYAPLSVQFNDLSINETGWQWNFGDGNYSTQQNPMHTYFTAGTYTVNLTVNNTNGTDSKLAIINVSQPVTFTPVPTTGSCVDNTKKIAVYMANMTRKVYSVSAGDYIDVSVTYDPLTTAMLYEYDPDYISDSNLESLTPANYGLLIVPMQQMSDTAATAINTYISNGGSVWFLNDPCLTPNGSTSANRITILGTGVSAAISDSTTITVVNTDDVTNGLPESFKPVGTISKTSYFRSMSGSGTISDMNYQVLMSSGTNAILIKYENPSTGARVIYSNPNMFISGGTSSYFSVKTATQLFMQTKAWVMKLAQNPSGVSITYPNSDKQFIITCDDVYARDEGAIMDVMFNMEKEHGLTPNVVNTFFIVPNDNMRADELAYYVQNGDTQTLHPHLVDSSGATWDIPSTSVGAYKNNIDASKNIINTLMGTTDYGFTSWRFPMTTFCTNSTQAVSNSGFIIESSTGNGTESMEIGNSQDNTVFFPKQALVNNVKSNLIEIELPAFQDIACSSGIDFYNRYNALTPQFKDVNFPANFIIGCHFQGAGTNGLPNWGVTAKNLTEGLGMIIDAEKAANPSYSNFNVLANYINGIKSANITASISGNTTNVTVVNTKPITDFTIKVALGSIASATCDGSPVSVKEDNLTNSSYITSTINAGTHTFVISGSSNSEVPVLPVANFSSNVTYGYAPLSVNFTDLSTNATGWKWDFGDGNNSTERNPIHEFSTPGIYTVNLTASNENGTNATSKTITVNEKPLSVIPVANFTANLTVKFTDISTNNPTSWEWNFGDGTNSTEQNPVHVYNGEGTYHITLVATNAAGSSDVRSMVITVNSVPTSPVANFTANTTEGYVPLTVQFTDISTNNPTEWEWNFGDGTNSTEQNPVHVFINEGTYNVTLVAINGGGPSAGKSMNITVNRIPTPPVANFIARQTGSLTIQFNDTSSNSPNEWNWNFGDGANSTDANPVHAYAAGGNYTVNLSVGNADGTNATSKTINAAAMGSPKAIFTAVPRMGRAPLTVKFTNRSVNTTSVIWDFGDKSASSTESNPSHIYNTRGFYTAKLTAINGNMSNVASTIIIVGR